MDEIYSLMRNENPPPPPTHTQSHTHIHNIQNYGPSRNYEQCCPAMINMSTFLSLKVQTGIKSVVRSVLPVPTAKLVFSRNIMQISHTSQGNTVGAADFTFPE